METIQTKNRIWEIDFLRGLLIPGMIAIHLIYDVVDLYGFWDVTLPGWYLTFKNNYGASFVLLSGLSVTLGSRSIRRGAVVFSGGMICTAVTAGMYFLGAAGRGIIIYFGVLHCLGVCMMLWPVLSRAKPWLLAAVGVVLVAAGWHLRGHVYVDFPWLLPLGLQYPGFASSDYFPLMPNLGYFLLGAAAGKLLYPQKTTRLPRVNAQAPVIRAFCGMGRKSLLIYLLHQPVLAGLCMLMDLVGKL